MRKSSSDINLGKEQTAAQRKDILPTPSSIFCLLIKTFAVLTILLPVFYANANANETAKSSFAQDHSHACVILLHGLGRSSLSMKRVDSRLSNLNYHVVNVSYPSLKHPIEQLADIAVKEGLSACAEKEVQNINFVTHSLGGILVRQFLSNNKIANLNRVVMLGPPNQGSQLADYLNTIQLVKNMQPEAGRQLGTGKNSVPKQLGPVNFELGVIAGNKNRRPLVSSAIPGKSDGTVLVEETKIAGMKDFIELSASHTFMMWKTEVLHQVEHFLDTGLFDHDSAQ